MINAETVFYLQTSWFNIFLWAYFQITETFIDLNETINKIYESIILARKSCMHRMLLLSV
jgi:hypothetical protein